MDSNSINEPITSKSKLSKNEDDFKLKTVNKSDNEATSSSYFLEFKPPSKIFSSPHAVSSTTGYSSSGHFFKRPFATLADQNVNSSRIFKEPVLIRRTVSESSADVHQRTPIKNNPKKPFIYSRFKKIERAQKSSIIQKKSEEAISSNVNSSSSDFEGQRESKISVKFNEDIEKNEFDSKTTNGNLFPVFCGFPTPKASKILLLDEEREEPVEEQPIDSTPLIFSQYCGDFATGPVYGPFLENESMANELGEAVRVIEVTYENTEITEQCINQEDNAENTIKEDLVKELCGAVSKIDLSSTRFLERQHEDTSINEKVIPKKPDRKKMRKSKCGSFNTSRFENDKTSSILTLELINSKGKISRKVFKGSLTSESFIQTSSHNESSSPEIHNINLTVTPSKSPKKMAPKNTSSPVISSSTHTKRLKVTCNIENKFSPVTTTDNLENKVFVKSGIFDEINSMNFKEADEKANRISKENTENGNDYREAEYSCEVSGNKYPTEIVVNFIEEMLSKIIAEAITVANKQNNDFNSKKRLPLASLTSIENNKHFSSSPEKPERNKSTRKLKKDSECKFTENINPNIENIFIKSYLKPNVTATSDESEFKASSTNSQDDRYIFFPNSLNSFFTDESAVFITDESNIVYEPGNHSSLCICDSCLEIKSPTLNNVTFWPQKSNRNVKLVDYSDTGSSEEECKNTQLTKQASATSSTFSCIELTAQMSNLNVHAKEFIPRAYKTTLSMTSVRSREFLDAQELTSSEIGQVFGENYNEYPEITLISKSSELYFDF